MGPKFSDDGAIRQDSPSSIPIPNKEGKTIIDTSLAGTEARVTSVSEVTASGSRCSTKGRRYGPRSPRPGHPTSPFGLRRPSRASCDSLSFIAGKAPEGSRPTTNHREWIAAVDAALADSGFYANRRASIRSVAKVLLGYQNFKDQKPLPTCSPLWGPVKKNRDDNAPNRAGVGRATFHRAWEWLVANNLLSKIAWGREESFKPAYLQGTAGEEGNDRAVYGFVVPANVRQAEVDVDELDTLTGNSGSSNTPQRAHTRIQQPASQRKKAFASLRRLTKGGSAALRHLLLDRKDPLPSRGETAKRLGSASPSRKSQALFAASVIAEMPNPLRHLSPQHMAHLLRQAKIFDADWTVNDVLWALCNRPDEGEWRRGHEVRHVAGWVKFRLAAHSGPDGRPVDSKSQRDRAYQEQMRAELRAAEDRRAKDRELRAHNLAVARGDVEPGPGRQAFLAEREARRRLGKGSR